MVNISPQAEQGYSPISSSSFSFLILVLGRPRPLPGTLGGLGGASGFFRGRPRPLFTTGANFFGVYSESSLSQDSSSAATIKCVKMLQVLRSMTVNYLHVIRLEWDLTNSDKRRRQ